MVLIDYLPINNTAELVQLHQFLVAYTLVHHTLGLLQ